MQHSDQSSPPARPSDQAAQRLADVLSGRSTSVSFMVMQISLETVLQDLDASAVSDARVQQRLDPHGNSKDLLHQALTAVGQRGEKNEDVSTCVNLAILLVQYHAILDQPDNQGMLALDRALLLANSLAAPCALLEDLLLEMIEHGADGFEPNALSVSERYEILQGKGMSRALDALQTANRPQEQRETLARVSPMAGNAPRPRRAL